MYKEHALKLFAVFISLSCHAMYIYDLPEFACSKKVNTVFQHTNKPHKKVPRVKKIAPFDSMLWKLYSRQQEPLISPMPSIPENARHSSSFEPQDDIVLAGDFSTPLINEHPMTTMRQELKQILKEPIEGCIETIHENKQRLVKIKDSAWSYLTNQNKAVENAHQTAKTDIQVNLSSVRQPEDHVLKQINPDSFLPKPQDHQQSHHQSITDNYNYVSNVPLTNNNPDKQAKNTSSQLNISKAEQVDDINQMVNTDMQSDLDSVIQQPENQDHSLKQANPESSCPKPQDHSHDHHQPITSHYNHISKRILADNDVDNDSDDEEAEDNSSKLMKISKEKILLGAAISAALIYVLKQINDKKQMKHY